MTKYEKRKKDGVTTWYPEIAEGIYADTGTTVDPGGTAAYLGSRVGKLYTPEAQKRTTDIAQFGSGGSKALYFFSCDARDAGITQAQWLAAGATRLSQWTSDRPDGSEPFSAVPDARKFIYQTESGLHGDKEGFWFWASSLAEMEQNYLSRINAWGTGTIWAANIETSNYWERYYHGDANGNGNIGHYPPWPQIKNVTIQLESQTGSMTVEQLFNSGIFAQEKAVRRSNRFKLMLKIAKRGGADVCFGSAIYQGDPGENTLTQSNRFLDEAEVNVNNIGGSNGTITLNNRTYTGMTGSFWSEETIDLDYYYYFGFLYKGQYMDQAIFENPNHDYHSETTCEGLYANMSSPNPVAREVGHWLGLQKRLRDMHGGNTIPIIRMAELIYEGNFSRWPRSFNLDTTYPDGGTPKVWILPSSLRTQRIVAQFLEGERQGSGYHVFHAAGSPNQGIIYNAGSTPYLNHAWHSISTLFAAGRDMETILDKIANSTLTTDMDIRIGNTGDFQRINGVDAWNQNKPCAVSRHKTTSEGLGVLFCFGYGQPGDTTRTDQFRIPGVGNGCVFEATYKGPDVQLFEALIPNGVSNQVIPLRSIVPAQTKPGYGGRINQ